MGKRFRKTVRPFNSKYLKIYFPLSQPVHTANFMWCFQPQNQMRNYKRTDDNERPVANLCTKYCLSGSAVGTAIPVQAYYRPRGFQEFQAPGFRDSRHMRAVRFSALHIGHLYLPPKYSWCLLLLEADLRPGAEVWPKGICHWKIPMIPSGFEPATFRLVAQCLNQLCRHITFYLPHSMFQNSPQET